MADQDQTSRIPAGGPPTQSASGLAIAEKDTVRSLERGIAVILAFNGRSGSLSLGEVSQITGIPRAAARRFLLTLIKLGYVDFDGRAFRLRPPVLQLGSAYLSTLTVPDVARPHMERLVGRLDETSSLAVLDGADIVYIVRVPTRRIMSITVTIGTRLPAYATSMGHVLLSGLTDQQFEELLSEMSLEPLTPHTVTSRQEFRKMIAKTRDDNFSIVDQELEEGLRTVGVPIRDATGHVIAALAVSALSSRTSLDELRSRFLPATQECASAIEADLMHAADTVAFSLDSTAARPDRRQAAVLADEAARGPV